MSQSIVENPVFPEMGGIMRAGLESLNMDFMGEIEVRHSDGSSHEGYVSFCDGYVEASVLLGCDELRGFLKANFPESAGSLRALDIIDRVQAQSFRDAVESAADDAGIEYEPDVFRIGDDLEKFYESAESLKEDVARKTGEDICIDGEEGIVLMSLCASLWSREENPFQLVLSVNFDEPYFRSNSMQRHNGMEGNLDIEISRLEREEPKSAVEFREDVAFALNAPEEKDCPKP